MIEKIQQRFDENLSHKSITIFIIIFFIETLFLLSILSVYILIYFSILPDNMSRLLYSIITLPKNIYNPIYTLITQTFLHGQFLLTKEFLKGLIIGFVYCFPFSLIITILEKKYNNSCFNKAILFGLLNLLLMGVITGIFFLGIEILYQFLSVAWMTA